MLGGGLEKLLLELGKQMSSYGIDVTIITTETPGPWFDKIAEYGINSLHIESLGKYSPFDYISKIAETIKEGKYKVVFLNHARFAQAAINLLPDDIGVVPVVHSMDEIYHRMSCINSLKWNAIVGVSPLVTQMLENRVSDRPIKMIPNGIPNILVRYPEKRSFSTKPWKLVYVGRLHHQEKGILLLPQIIHKLNQLNKDIFLDVVGDGVDRHLLETEVQRLAISEKVKFWGNLESKQIYQLLSTAHCLLFPSLREAFGLVLIEAQISGCIPIASRIEGVTDFIIRDWENGILVERENINDFCNKIITLFEDPQKASAISESAQINATKNFSIERTARDYCQLVNEIIEDKYPVVNHRNKDDNKLEELLALFSINSDSNIESLYRVWMSLLATGNKGITNLLHKFHVKNVVIFGTLKTALLILYDLNLEGFNVVCFLDNNQQMHGKSLMNIPVYPTEWLKSNSTIIDSVIVSVESEGDIYVKRQIALLIDNNAQSPITVLSWKDLVSSLS